MYQLQDALQEQTVSDKLAYFSDEELKQELALRERAQKELSRYYQHIYENKDVVDFDELTREPFLTEER